MQRKKDEIREIILQAARSEFLKRGFEDSSMRNIARKSGVGLSNIYNYFKSKDEIFREDLSKLLRTMDLVMKDHNSASNVDLFLFDSNGYGAGQIKMFVDLIYLYREDFKLLFFKSSGSSLENYREECIARQTAIGKEYLSLVKKKFPDTSLKISDFFIHTMSSSWMSSIAEIVMHDLSRDDIEIFIDEYLKYEIAGWKKIMNIK